MVRTRVLCTFTFPPVPLVCLTVREESPPSLPPPLPLVSLIVCYGVCGTVVWDHDKRMAGMTATEHWVMVRTRVLCTFTFPPVPLVCLTVREKSPPSLSPFLPSPSFTLVSLIVCYGVWYSGLGPMPGMPAQRSIGLWYGLGCCARSRSPPSVCLSDCQADPPPLAPHSLAMSLTVCMAVVQWFMT